MLLNRTATTIVFGLLVFAVACESDSARPNLSDFAVAQTGVAGTATAVARPTSIPAPVRSYPASQNNLGSSASFVSSYLTRMRDWQSKYQIDVVGCSYGFGDPPLRFDEVCTTAIRQFPHTEVPAEWLDRHERYGAALQAHVTAEVQFIRDWNQSWLNMRQIGLDELPGCDVARQLFGLAAGFTEACRTRSITSADLNQSTHEYR